MFQWYNVQSQSQPTIRQMSPKLPYSPAMTRQGTIQTTTPSSSVSKTKIDEVVISMGKRKLVHDSDDSTKLHKTDNNMDLADHLLLINKAISTPTPTKKIDNRKKHAFLFAGQQ